MFKLIILLFLGCILPTLAEFSDYMQIYEQECLGENRMHCRDGSCIWHHQYCDGNVDCTDGSDENACLDHTPSPELCEESLHFLCSDKKRCIPRVLVCNNYTDCEDNSDERSCTDAPMPLTNKSTCKGFKCVSDGKCISQLWMCDGTYDCDDHSDEETDTCWHTLHSYQRHSMYDTCTGDSIHPKRYSCLDGHLCLLPHNMCDGVQDCKDASDEGDFCKNWTKMCTKDTCKRHLTNATCYSDREGPVCICPSFMEYNYTTQQCFVVHMCEQSKPYCPQICTDHSDGAYLCDCEEGYLKDTLLIGHVCMAPDPEGILFFTVKNEIKYLGLKSQKMTTVATGLKEAHGVSYDGQYLYWVEKAQGHQAIMRAHLDNVPGTKQIIVSLGLEDPGDIAVDWLGGHIYLSDAQRGIISVCRADGSLCATLPADARLPKFLTLDVKNGKMYWADWHHKPIIMSAAMDGSNSSVLTDKLTMFAAGLTVDAPSQRLYFVDTTLRGVRLDDGTVFTLFDQPEVHQPYAVAVFERHIYWSDWVSNTIQMTDKMSGSADNVVAVLDSPVYGLHIYHPILQRAKHNACAKNPCSHFCLLTSNVTYTCACPDGMELDNRTSICQPKKDYRPQYLVVAGGATLTRIQYDTLGNPETHASHFDIGRVQAMAYDSLRDVLYMFDAQRKSINYVNMSDFLQGVTRVLLYRGLDNVVDMDYDYVTDSLYFVDSGRSFVEVVSLRTGKRAMLHRFESEVPISLCVLPAHGKMLVAVAASDQNSNIHIDSFGLDGSRQIHVLMNDLKGPHIRLRYSKKQDLVYLSDEGNSIIDRMQPQGLNRETYRELSTTVTNLAVTDTLVLWSDRRSSRLYWADIYDTSSAIRRIEFSIFPNTSHLHVLPTTRRPEVPFHPCQRHPCSDVCVQAPTEVAASSFFTGILGYTAIMTTASPQGATGTNTGYKCLCPPGLLNIDGNCKELTSCKEDEAYCHNSNVCIRKTLLCDGKRDCFHGEDEDDCAYTHVTNTTNCGITRILCDGQCIDKNQVCVPNVTSSAPDMCRVSQFKCTSGDVCIERAQQCDGVTDCPDDSDEARSLCATLNCLHTEFMCTSGHCILQAFRCDGDLDCYDGSDEQNCGNKTCPQGTYRCRNSKCVDMTRRCDGQFDCEDNSDEDDCGEPDYVDAKEEIENCAEWEHTCELDRSVCVPIGARCNGKTDCPGNTDEVGCGSRCPKNQLRCSDGMTCVSAPRVCDGTKHCVDGADETAAACKTVNKTSTLYPAILPAKECVSGYRCGSGECVEWSEVCDDRQHCRDGEDEGAACETACANNSCSHICRASPRGPRCGCPPGYQLSADRSTCVDVDECTTELCSQHCHNTPGSFLCSCHRGYALRFDRRSCKAVRGDMSVLYVTGNSVRSVTADGLVATEFNDSKVASITDMDYDVRSKFLLIPRFPRGASAPPGTPLPAPMTWYTKKLYVTSAESGALKEVNSTGNTVTVTNIGRPTKVAVDWVSGNVYFVDQSPAASYIRVCHVGRKRCAALQKLPARSTVTSLIIDPSSRRLFYSVTRDLESVIWSSTLSGTRLVEVAVVHNCTGLAVDTFKKIIYIAETGPSRIESTDYEGNKFKQVVTDDPHLQAPHDLAIFEDHIYFLVANSFKLNRCLLFNTKHCELYLQKVFNANVFVIRHASVQRDDVLDVCADTKCDNVCVAGDLAPVCLCFDGKASRNGKCPLVEKTELLPLFNGWTYQEQHSGSEVALVIVGVIAAALALYFILTPFYHRVFKPWWLRRQAANFTSVHFQNSLSGDTPGVEGLSPITTPIVQMPPTGATTNEFVNPLQFFRDWRTSFYRRRPIGTAGLTIEVPNMNVSEQSTEQLSDTESECDENKLISKRKNRPDQTI